MNCQIKIIYKLVAPTGKYNIPKQTLKYSADGHNYICEVLEQRHRLDPSLDSDCKRCYCVVGS